MSLMYVDEDMVACLNECVVSRLFTAAQTFRISEITRDAWLDEYTAAFDSCTNVDIRAAVAARFLQRLDRADVAWRERQEAVAGL